MSALTSVFDRFMLVGCTAYQLNIPTCQHTIVVGTDRRGRGLLSAMLTRVECAGCQIGSLLYGGSALLAICGCFHQTGRVPPVGCNCAMRRTVISSCSGTGWLSAMLLKMVAPPELGEWILIAPRGRFGIARAPREG